MDEGFEIRFQEVFSVIAELYDKNPSTFLFDIWFNALERFEIDSIERAFNIHAQTPETGRFMPKPADIIQIIEGSSKDVAYSAWTKIKKAVGMVGSYQTVVFDDPIIHRVLQDMGGWIRICSLPEKDLPFSKNEFLNRYKGFKQQGETPEYPPKLIGITEGENRVGGFTDQIPEPVLIGNPEQAQEVMLLGSDRPALQITDGIKSNCLQNNNIKTTRVFKLK